METWAPTLVFLAISLFVPASMLIASVFLRVRAKVESPAKRDTYECGEEPDGPAWVQFHPRYYVVALVFVLFDVEAAFLFPWVLNLRTGNVVMLVSMLVFVGVLLLGWWYALRKGALKWQ